MAGVYFHIPFCKRVCAYCDFYKSVRLDRMEELTGALAAEARQIGRASCRERVSF